MILAKVLARVVASARLENLPQGLKLLECQALDGFGETAPIVAIDTVEAGPGDTVLILQEGTGVRQAIGLDAKFPLPSQMAIVGIVDSIQRG